MIKDKIEKIISRNSTKHKYKLAGKRLHKMFNGISNGDYTLVTGLPATGKRSFVDFYYVIRIIEQWDALSKEEKALRPLKILYFSTKYSIDYKMMKWTSALFTATNPLMVDVPTLLQGAGRLFNMGENMFEKVIAKAGVLERAIEAGVLEIRHTDVTPITMDKAMYSVLKAQGKFTYADDGNEVFEPHEDYENALNIVVVDDLNHVGSSKSSYGEGNMERDEVSTALNALLVRYSTLGMSVVAVKRTDSSKLYGMYRPSSKEMNGLSPTKCIVMYDPIQDKHAEYINFTLVDFIDAYGVNRLKFAYIAYNETGISNINMPLLFTPENGIFVELKLVSSDMETDYNMKKFDMFVKKRDKTKPKKD